MADLEKWESSIKGTIGVNKFNPSGPPGSTLRETIYAGRQFLITSEERNLLNSDRAADPSMDPFKNGMLRPVIVADQAGEAAAAEAQILEEAQRAAEPNPNHKSDEELLALFSERNHFVFKKLVSKITSEQVLERLIIIAADDEANALSSQTNIIKELLEKARPESATEIIEIEQTTRVGGLDDTDRSGLQPFKG